MKSLFTIFLLFNFTFLFSQIIQDWDLSPLGQKTYFERDSGFLEMYYNDSTEVYSDYRKHFFGEKYYKDGLLGCYDEIRTTIIDYDDPDLNNRLITGWTKNNTITGLVPNFNLYYQDHLVGDIYKWRIDNYPTFTPFPSGWTKEVQWRRDSITNVTIFPDSLIELTFDRTRLTFYQDVDGNDTTLSTSIDLVIKFIKPINPHYYSPPDYYVNNQGQIIKTNAIKRKNNSDTLITSTDVSYHWVDNNCVVDQISDNVNY